MTRTLSWLFSAIAFLSVLLLAGVFFSQSLPAWQQEGTAYVTGHQWFYSQHQFGALSLIYGSVVVSLVALLLAGPVGLGTALFVAEYLPNRLRPAVKLPIELLAGIPSVVYGLLGILLLRDWVYDVFERFEPLSGDTLLTAGILLAIMLLPTVVSLCEDAFRAIPSAQRRAARALGLTRAETIWSVCLPQARQGITSAFLLALGRALGETVAVFLVVGRQDNNLPTGWLSPSHLLQAGQTLTSKLGSSETNIAYGDPLHWSAIMGLGVLLLLLTGGITLLGTLRRSRNA